MFLKRDPLTTEKEATSASEWDLPRDNMDFFFKKGGHKNAIQKPAISEKQGPLK